MVEKEHFKVTEAAKYLDVSTATLYRWSQKGIIKIYRIGDGVARIKKEDLDRLLAESKPIHEPKNGGD